MKINIHGTVDGYGTLYSEGIIGTKEIISDSPRASSLGKQFYSLSFKNDEILISKNVNVRDKIGDARFGFLAVTLSLSKTERLSGSNIVVLLDALLKQCLEIYSSPEFEVKNADSDFSFVDKIKRNFTTVSNPFSEGHFQSGSDDPAYFYYQNKDELQNILDDPSWEIFKDFKQIFLIDINFKNRDDNPLLDLRHNPSADLTNKIDTRNTRYKIQFSSKTTQGASVILKVNNERKESGAIFRKNDLLELSFKRDNYQSISKSGNIDSLRTEFLEVDELSRLVTIKNITLEPIRKRVRFEVLDEDYKKIEGATLWLSSENRSKKPINVEEEFIGDDIDKEYKVNARASEDIYSAEKVFVPRDETLVSLTVKPHKTIRFVVYDATTNKEIKNATVFIEGKSRKGENTFEFVGKNQIQREWQTTFSAGEEYEESSRSFRPSENDIIKLELRKRKKYSIDPGNYGRHRSYSPGFTYNQNEKKYKKYIKPDRGYRFEKFEFIKEKSGEYAGTLRAIYKKKRFSPKMIMILLTGLFILFAGSVGGYRLIFKQWPLKNSITKIWEGITFWNGTDNEICEGVQEEPNSAPNCDGNKLVEHNIKEALPGEVENISPSEDNTTRKPEDGSNVKNVSGSTTTSASQPQNRTGRGENEFQKQIKGSFNLDNLENYTEDTSLSEEEKRSLGLAIEFKKIHYSQEDKDIREQKFRELFNKVSSDPILKQSVLYDLLSVLSDPTKSEAYYGIQKPSGETLNGIKEKMQNENN